MTTPTDTPVATNPYPITLTREALVDKGACPEGLEAFDAVCPTGVLTIPNAHAHSALLGTALGAHEDWAITKSLLPPVYVQGPDRARVAAGIKGHATAGDYGHATVGDYGHATTGYEGHATAGNFGHATAGAFGHATVGDEGHAIAGDYGHATAGDDGHATVGYMGRATAGDGGHATAGDYGHATAGHAGHATAGYKGHATAGDMGTLRLAYWANGRERWATAYVGEDGIEPNVAYRVDYNGVFGVFYKA